MMNTLSKKTVWFITGSQHLYGPEVLEQINCHAGQIVDTWNREAGFPVEIVFKPVVTSPESILSVCMEAGHDPLCIGTILWMHTFSPAKMWIGGLQVLRKPYLHLNTQFNRDIPWKDIDMDFMNLNQSAHGDREFGFINARLRQQGKVMTGHWKDPEIFGQIRNWCRVALGWNDSQGLKVARFGDNMREVAVTEGDKVEAQIRFGWQISAFGPGDLLEKIRKVRPDETEALYMEYEQQYEVAADCRPGQKYHDHVLIQARYEIALRNFLKEGRFKAFTTNFENLTGLEQLPGLASQRLMAEGYGFGAEGDWKQAAMLRIIKTMSKDLPGGSSFMEDYTYHFDPECPLVLGSHMLEICPSIASGKPRLEVHPLGIGGKEAPARLVFNSKTGAGMNVTLIDLGNRFRMIANTLEVISPLHDLPKLPVARALWKPHPNLNQGAAAWILAGGTHHSVFTLALTPEYMETFAELFDVEFILIDQNTRIRELKKELRWNEVYYHLNRGFQSR